MATLKARFRKKFQKEKCSDDAYQKEHRKNFLPTLETLVGMMRAKKRSHEWDVPSKRLAFLNDFGFFEDIKSSHPNVDVSQDLLNQKLCLKGRGDEFNSAYNKCSGTLHEIVDDILKIDDMKIWDLIAESRVQEHLKRTILSKHIKAQVCLIVSYFSFLINITSLCVSIYFIHITYLNVTPY